MSKIALIGATIFDGTTRHENSALLLADDACSGVVVREELPDDFEVVELDSGLLAPGFIDLQVNGGGGVMFNDQPNLMGIQTICDAHARFGTTGLLPTLITDTPDVTAHALYAGFEAAENNVPGFLGLHLEGPHLDVARKGAHRADYIRPMLDKDVVQLCEARKHLRNLMVTVAPESVSDEQITELADAGIVVSLGHTDIDAKRAKQAFAAGASCVTHLYNAMSGLSHREPGLVGATLNSDAVFAGLIADGHHVAPDAINIALRSKTGTGKVFLVTDAMSVIGTDLAEFTLNGRKIFRADGKLTLEDGTLAGADLDMMSAIAFMQANTSLGQDEVLRMASLYPAQCLGVEADRGSFAKDRRADVVHVADDLMVKSVWRAGQKLVRRNG